MLRYRVVGRRVSPGPEKLPGDSSRIRSGGGVVARKELEVPDTGGDGARRRGKLTQPEGRMAAHRFAALAGPALRRDPYRMGLKENNRRSR